MKKNWSDVQKEGEEEVKEIAYRKKSEKVNWKKKLGGKNLFSNTSQQKQVEESKKSFTKKLSSLTESKDKDGEGLGKGGGRGGGRGRGGGGGGGGATFFGKKSSESFKPSISSSISPKVPNLELMKDSSPQVRLRQFKSSSISSPSSSSSMLPPPMPQSMPPPPPPGISFSMPPPPSKIFFLHIF